MENELGEKNKRGARRIIWLLLPVLLLLSIALVAIPVLLIQPFRPQTQRALEISYMLRHWSPLATVLMLVGAAGLVFWQWAYVRRWWRKTLLIILLLLMFVPAWFARQNHFEWMFNPLRQSAYVKSQDASFVRDSDMVLAVKINNEAVAYPVRLMAYHHLVQDLVGGTPICATY
jgi:flagellar basal body-associated protein FliL